MKDPRAFGIDNWRFDEHGYLHVNGHVDLRNKNLKVLPFKFGNVNGDFDCSYNQLETLEGSPYIVNRSFDCSFNCLKSFKSGPKEVQDLFADNNQIKSLENLPEINGQYLTLSFNPIKTINSIPSDIFPDVSLLDLQKTLVSVDEINKLKISNEIKVLNEKIKYDPKDFNITDYCWDDRGFLNVFGNVDLFENRLVEIPFNFGMVKGSFNIGYNRLTTLKGSPQVLKGSFDCHLNEQLKTLNFFPKEFEGAEVNCFLTGISHIKQLEHFKQIEKLNISKTKITSLNNFSNFKNLSNLLMSYCQIYHITEDLFNQLSLIQINDFTEPNENYDFCPKLEEMNYIDFLKLLKEKEKNEISERVKTKILGL